MLDFYKLLACMPHIQPDALRIPPAGGWTGVNTEKLRQKGKSEQAIDFLRQLPCLVHRPERRPERPGLIWHERPDITPDSRSIYFCDGETIKDYVEEILPTPGHIVWLAEAITRDGIYLLLDTSDGNIIEFGIMSGGERTLSWEEYQARPPKEKWSVWKGIPAHEYFSRQHRRIQYLICMPVPPSTFSNSQDTVYLFRAEGLECEADLIAHGDAILANEKLLAADDEDEDFDPSSSESDNEASDDDHDDDAISAGEVEDLNSTMDEHTPIQSAEPVTQSFLSKHFSGERTEVARTILKPRNMQVYTIYKRNGWPSNSFNREQCKAELQEWAANDGW